MGTLFQLSPQVISSMKRLLITSICSFILLLTGFSAQAATLSPSLIEISGDRDQVLQSEFSILNTGTSDQDYYIDLLSFVPSKESGTPQFMSVVEEEESTLTSWIKFDVAQVTVPAHTAVDLPFQVIIPDDIASGGYYAAITVSNAPADVVASNGAIIEAKTAILVLLTVEGETIEEIVLLDAHFEQTQGSLPTGTFSYRLQNQGNVHVAPEGTVVIRNMFGQMVGSVDANPLDGRVLPSTTRSYKVEIGKETGGFLSSALFQLSQFSFGTMVAQLQLEYGDKEIIQSQIQFVIVPWELISIIIGIGVLLSIIYLSSKRKTK
jgi:hypothetical protein